MVSTTSFLSSRAKLLDFLRGFAPFSVIERGELAAERHEVLESSRVENTVRGIVKDLETDHNVSLEFVSSRDVRAHCTCSSDSDMAEQWCHHAIAVLLRAFDLEFLQPDGGFASEEARYKSTKSAALEVADILRSLSSTKELHTNKSEYLPKVMIELDCNSTRFGLRVLFDGEPQGPRLFEGLVPSSSRALDNLLLEILDTEGAWDHTNSTWFVNDSRDIERVLGLLTEYEDIRMVNSKKKILWSTELIDAQLILQWESEGADLSLEWGTKPPTPHNHTLQCFGTGPYWIAIKNTIYKLSPEASKIASLFTQHDRIFVTRSQLSPVLEALSSDPTHLIVKNIDQKPEGIVVSPKIQIELAWNTLNDALSGSQVPEITALIQFIYPEPKENENIVYLADRKSEQEAVSFFKERQFSESGYCKFQVQGDTALDIINQGRTYFPKEWGVSGLDSLKKKVRFAEISLVIEVNNELPNSDGENNPIDWFECKISLVQNNAKVPISSLFKRYTNIDARWIALDSGAYAQVPGGSFRELTSTLGILDPNYRHSNAIRTRLSTAQALGLAALDVRRYQITLDRSLQQLREKLETFKGIKSVKIGRHFQGKLRSYQLDGVSWLMFLREFRLGGILADEMGLGKTVQTLAFLQYLKDKKLLKGPVLVVCPTSVIMNWVYETRKFTPELSVMPLQGPGRKKLFASIPETDIIVTSYALLRQDRFELSSYEFDYVILDEAQNIKNPQTATTKAARGLKCRQRLALTGTPTENRPMELWSIIDFLMPGYLGTYEYFRTHIERPILDGGPGVSIVNFLNSKTRPFILRRTKAEVEKDLPPKIESTLHVPMTPAQQELYVQILNDVKPKVFDAVKKKGVAGASISILAALLRLRQICNHPRSIRQFSALTELDSGKFDLLQEVVSEALDSGRKILLFSQFREMLSIIKDWIGTLGIKYLYLDGQTKNRQDLVDEFNSNAEVRLFLISLKAGGTGLNLPAADTVIIYDPWWNPAVENQAIDRSHRIGQTKTVNVYRLVTEDSVEQKIMVLKDKKSKLVDALVNENGLTSLKLSKTDLEMLFSSPV